MLILQGTAEKSRVLGRVCPCRRISEIKTVRGVEKVS